MYQALHRRIATGGLAPWEKITERGLATLPGVSATPVRKALRRLEQDHLVERTGPRGMAITRHSQQTQQEFLHLQTDVCATFGGDGEWCYPRRMRWRSRAKPARPCIWREIRLVLVLTPSVGPLLYWSVNAAAWLIDPHRFAAR